MCLFKEKQHYSVADEDIICFKVVRQYIELGPDKYFSSERGFRYCVGETYTEDSVPLSVLNSLYELEGGVFHSFITMYRGYVGNLVTLNRTEFIGYRRVILKCVIPAGTPYWKSDNVNAYASTSIKILEAIDPDDFLKNYRTFVP